MRIDGRPASRSKDAPHPRHSPAPTPQNRRSIAGQFLRYWLPVVVWMAVIFGFSTDAGSSRHTSRIIGPILRWFNPSISDTTVEGIQKVVRKGGHVTEYAILAVLLLRALASRDPAPAAGPKQPATARPWNPRHAVRAFVVAALFAVTDEWHQSTVPSRQGQVSDVLIDSAGAAAGLAIVRALARRRANR